MKLSYSTRGWDGLPWETMLRLAEELHFRGIELYNLKKWRTLYEAGGPFHADRVAATVRRVRDSRLELPCLDTCLELDREENVAELEWLFEMASAMHVPYVSAVVYREDTEEAVNQAISRLLIAAKKNHAALLIKTSGIYADTARLRNLLISFSDDSLGVLWDMHHP